MYKLKINKYLLFTAVCLVFASCDVFDTTADPDIYKGSNKVKFTNSSVTLFAEENTDEKTIQLSSLMPVSSQMSVDVSVVASASTAIEGTHYTLSNKSVTFSKDSTLADLSITLIKANLAEQKKLVLKITSADSAVFNNEIVLTLVEFNPYVQADFIGSYDMVYEWWFEDTTVRTVDVIVGANGKDIIIVDPIGSGYDWPVTMDDSDKTNFTASVNVNPGWVSGTYGDIIVEGSGSFSVPDKSITLDFTHCLASGGGCFGGTPNQMVLTKK